MTKEIFDDLIVGGTITTGVGLAATNVTKADLSTAGNFQIQFSVQYITDDD